MTDNEWVVYAPVAIPYEEDCDCDKLSKSEILYASTKFMNDYKRIDKDHCLAYGNCDLVGEPIDSIILSNDKTVKDFEGNNVTLPEGTWILGVKVTNQQVWNKIQNGTYKGVSLMGVSAKDGNRTTIEQLGKDWVATAVSIVANPCVPKAKFIRKESLKMEEETSKLRAFVESIKSAISSLEEEPVETVKEEEVVVDEPVEEEVVEEEVAEKEEEDDVTKSTDDEIIITGEHVEQAIKSMKEEPLDLVNEKLDSVIKSLEESKVEALKSVESAKDEEIKALKERIAELEKGIGQSKVIKDCGCHKNEPVIKNLYEDDGRDAFGCKL